MFTKNKLVPLTECVVYTQGFHICRSQTEHDIAASPPAAKRTIYEARRQEEE
jgi:hypothetical protein